MRIFKILIKILLGIASMLVPLTFITVFAILGNNNSSDNPFLIALVILAMLSFPGILAYYILFTYKSQKIAKDQRNLWTALLFFGNIIVYPIYWYLFIWREPKRIDHQP